MNTHTRLSEVLAAVDSTMSRAAFDPRRRAGMFAALRDALQRSALRTAVKRASSSSVHSQSMRWEEFAAKLRTLSLFSHTQTLLGILDDSDLELAELIRRTEILALDDRPWAVEGIGQYCAERCNQFGSSFRNLLRDEDLPNWSIGVLHTGVGIALAENCLRGVATRAQKTEIDVRIERFVTLCREAARPGYVGMAVECLGFVSRFLHPRVIPFIDKALLPQNNGLSAFFWHGVGRAIYFLPSNLSPRRSAPWRAFELASCEAPDPRTLDNMTAGLAWPFLLVNWRRPEILESVLSYHGKVLACSNAFSSGLSAAMIMWLECTDGASDIRNLLQHQPATDNDLWHHLIRRPCEEAIEVTYPKLTADNRLDALFRFPMT
ncbi:MAG: hypothetical protein GY906_34075 [bacterium]|nr:hypothetical protein [bacterium]